MASTAPTSLLSVKCGWVAVVGMETIFEIGFFNFYVPLKMDSYPKHTLKDGLFYVKHNSIYP